MCRVSKLPDIIRQSMLLVGGILLILGVSLASTNYMIDAQVPEMLIGVVNEYRQRHDQFSDPAVSVLCWFWARFWIYFLRWSWWCR